MNTYEFTLRFALPSTSTDMEAVADALYGGGCDDALVGIGRPGSVALDFTREARCAREAVMSVISDVTRALPGSTLTEVAPDLVGITDVADIVGCTRQNIRQLMAFGSSRVPAPVREGRPTLWHLSSILNWLVEEKRYQVAAALLDLAETTMRVNLALSAIQAEPDLEDDLRALLAYPGLSDSRMTEGAMMTDCCSGGTRVTVDVERLVVEGETCDRCASTWDAARQAVEMVAAEASGIGLAVDLREVPLSPERISDSNRVLVNGRLVEEWLDGSAAMTECASCGDLVGESVCCRSYEIDGLASDSLSAADIARAIRAAAGLAAPSESPTDDASLVPVVLVTSSACG